jgi:predicted esterase
LFEAIKIVITIERDYFRIMNFVQKGNLLVSKKARYFYIGDLQSVTTEIIYVLHGYGMQASEFIKEFEVLSQPGRLIIAPEGLSRFYRKGFSGDVVASWMTKDDRLDDIEDYVRYLNDLHLHILDAIRQPSCKVNILGFSQGVATASRWIANKTVKPLNFVAWCGDLAPDIVDKASYFPVVTFVYSSDDQFIPVSQSVERSKELSQNGFKVNEVFFEGQHVIDSQVLANVWQQITTD